MGNKSRVNVFARHDGKGGIDWSLTSNEKKPNGNLRYHRKNDENGWTIDFQLQDKTGRDLIFPDRLSDALWVKRANDPQDCCDRESAHDAFRPVALDSTKTVLTVQNTNETAEDLAFALRAIPRGKNQDVPTNFVEFDPIVENKNGSPE